MPKFSLNIIWLATLTGCAVTDVPDIGDSQAAGSPMAFVARMAEQQGAARGVVTDIDNLEAFAVSASVTGAGGSSVYFAHETFPVGRAGQQVHTSLSGQTYYWLDSDAQYDFFAYSPTTDMTFADGVVDKFDFTVNDDVAAQTDIVVCAAIDATYGGNVRLDFTHPLSKISLSQGAKMAGGTIESVSFSGICGKGAYDMRKGEWSVLAADTATFTYKCHAPASPLSSITGSLYNFFFIPQALGSDAQMRVNFVDSAGVAHDYTRQLTGQWLPGGSYNYSLSISPQLTFVVADSVVDAYYSMVKVKVDAPDILPGTQWAVTVTASDGADVSVQWQADVNSFAKLGFWTDNYIVNGVTTQSARGTSTTETVSGPASDYICVFVPENTGDTDRQITISAVSANATLASAHITQKCPAWADGTGWSQLDDGTLSDFGFCWNRSLAYVLPYSVSDYGLETDFSKTAALSMLNDMIKLADASDFTRIRTYYQYHIDNVGTIWHYYLYLDYSLCNALSEGSLVNGLSNTASLYDRGGTAATGMFQLMVSRAALSSSPGQTLFRLPSSAYSQEDLVPRPEGIANQSLSALCKVAKRNRYNYRVTQVGEAILEYPSLSPTDMVWYLPAVAQFRNLPAMVADPIVPSMCWSSTAVSGTTSAILGSGAVASRAAMAHVRCCRRPVSTQQ